MSNIHRNRAVLHLFKGATKNNYNQRRPVHWIIQNKPNSSKISNHLISQINKQRSNIDDQLNSDKKILAFTKNGLAFTAGFLTYHMIDLVFRNLIFST